jgi:predicted DCC family thiol-disulfide oxidoreductase YuxK
MNAGRLVLFDGVCGLCDRTVQILLREDKSQVLKFAPLQGTTAEQVMSRHPEIKKGLGSLVLVENFEGENEKIFVRSEGVFRILGPLGGIWTIVSWLRLIPRPVRDAVYDWVARNRYEWFGKFEECRIPSPETRARFRP